MRPVDRLEWFAHGIDAGYRLRNATALRWAVAGALAEPPPRGDPSELGAYGYQLAEGSAECDRERVTMTGLSLPDFWMGQAAVRAGDAITSLDGALRRAVDALDQGAAALKALSTALTDAQGRDELGRAPLRLAQEILDHLTPVLDDAALARAHEAASTGVGHLIAAAHMAEEAGELAARQLAELASEAHTAGLTTVALTDLDKVVLTGAAVPGPPGLDEFNLILTADATDRASARLDGLAPEERRRFDALLAGSSSVQERAYLMQALAAGHTLAELEAFDRKIHQHGADPNWLRDHLTPGATVLGPTGGPSRVDVTFDGKQWTQGVRPTCVAGAAVFARARIDPLYALDLTTGGHPDDPQYDSGDAFEARLRDEQQRVYAEGRWFLQDWVGRDGLTDGGTEDVVNAELHDPTGRDYELVDVNSQEDRRETLATVEDTVDRGVPVTFGVRDGTGSHEMVVFGHEGDQLQVYNPWGYTMWVPESAFIDGHLDMVGQQVPATFDDATLPRH